MRDHLLVHINGAAHRLGEGDATRTLSRYLREVRGMTGTKIVCEEGDCGACTVLVGRVKNGALEYRPVNSCIQSMFQLDCTHVVTVEGLAPRGGMTPVQEAMVRCHGAQCGYCTPGFVMALAGMYESTRRPTPEAACSAITGNLCRCTGYEPIVKAALETEGQPRVDDIYPAAPILEAIEASRRDEVRIGHFFRARDLDGAVAFKAEHPQTTIVQGATDFGVWTTKRGFIAPSLLSLDGIEGLDEVRIDDHAIVAGGCATLATFESAVRDVVPELREILDRFGSPQIRNSGTLAGNIANASPIADSLPFLYVMQATLELTGTAGPRLVPIHEFYLGYKKLDLRPDEIITRIIIPRPAAGETLRLYKVSKRSHLDIASFTAGMLMRRAGDRIDSIRIAYGGVGPVVLRLPRTEEFLGGRPVALESFTEAGVIARGEVNPISDVRGSRDYRLQLAQNILSRFFYEACT